MTLRRRPYSKMLVSYSLLIMKMPSMPGVKSVHIVTFVVSIFSKCKIREDTELNIDF